MRPSPESIQLIGREKNAVYNHVPRLSGVAGHRVDTDSGHL
jgi:hypothetical protein